ncbi:pre-mRNA-splicing factor 38B-like [Haliotis rubra]|uniref:pre-mRNA-splicing factor 38B-like n=1 Tax=Haliotis rubra TaxID=36100 RepID=UPI001EE5E1FC|nr:pre-mRNA-splicing factor 38B-like [Haliotis rubra]
MDRCPWRRHGRGPDTQDGGTEGYGQRRVAGHEREEQSADGDTDREEGQDMDMAETTDRRRHGPDTEWKTEEGHDEQGGHRGQGRTERKEWRQRNRRRQRTGGHGGTTPAGGGRQRRRRRQTRRTRSGGQRGGWRTRMEIDGEWTRRWTRRMTETWTAGGNGGSGGHGQREGVVDTDRNKEWRRHGQEEEDTDREGRRQWMDSGGQVDSGHGQGGGRRWRQRTRQVEDTEWTRHGRMDGGGMVDMDMEWRETVDRRNMSGDMEGVAGWR